MKNVYSPVKLLESGLWQLSNGKKETGLGHVAL